MNEGGRCFDGNDAQIGCLVDAARDRKRVAASAGSISNFEVGDYGWVPRVCKLSSAPNSVTA